MPTSPERDTAINLPDEFLTVLTLWNLTVPLILDLDVVDRCRTTRSTTDMEGTHG